MGEELLQGLPADLAPVLLRACASMLAVPVDPDTLHATLRLCLRLTRRHAHALLFAELRSPRTILGLTQSSGFTGFTPLVTLLLRHVIEDPATLRHTMEKVPAPPHLWVPFPPSSHAMEKVPIPLYPRHCQYCPPIQLYSEEGMGTFI